MVGYWQKVGDTKKALAKRIGRGWFANNLAIAQVRDPGPTSDAKLSVNTWNSEAFPIFGRHCQLQFVVY